SQHLGQDGRSFSNRSCGPCSQGRFARLIGGQAAWITEMSRKRDAADCLAARMLRGGTLRLLDSRDLCLVPKKVFPGFVHWVDEYINDRPDDREDDNGQQPKDSVPRAHSSHEEVGNGEAPEN